MSIRNRIKGHRRVRAGDLVPHELNFRLHPEAQRAALEALYEEVGFARSVLAYELPDGRLKLIDGHLRRELDPDMEIDVEILDVDSDEARALLLSMDPLAALAQTDRQIHARLLEATPTENEALADLWQAAQRGREQADRLAEGVDKIKEQFLVLIECADEAEQKQLLARFAKQGLTCRALLA